jgi:hypothetical protein
VSAASLLARGRAAAAALMVDACTIQHVTGSTTNTTTGMVTPTYSTLYTGPCKVQGGQSDSGQDVGEAHLAVLGLTVHVPISVVGVVETDVVTITASVNDPELVGRVFRVSGPVHKSYATARRLPVIEVTS